MNKLKFIFISLFIFTLLSGCQTIKNKTDAIVKKENEKLSQYIGKTLNNLQIDLLSIDIDSNDLEIWESIIKYKPKIVIIEINSGLLPNIRQRHNAELGLQGNSFQSTLDVAKKKGYSPIVHTGNLILLRDELIDLINFDNDLLKNPNKLFIYDWINKNKENKIIKLLKFFIPNLIRKKISVRLKYNFLKIFK